ncbi:MAG: hypothetical protein DLD55_04390 [candidate division SR1 bacterium]|nr:MAG: hypothetical protein DLD55_04390 [candidate division SR1 bacterium]
MRNTTYAQEDYLPSAKKLLHIPFDITTVLYEEKALQQEIVSFHCVAALRKVLFDTLGFCLAPCYVGELPLLLKAYNYEKVLTNQIQNGDIMCLRKKTRDRISHVVLGLQNQYVFHACRSRGTVIELLSCLEDEYFTIVD